MTAEAYVRYLEKSSYNRNGMTLALLSTFLGNSFSFVGGFDGATTTQATQSFNNALLSGGFLTDAGDDTRPYAYLSYIVFDGAMTHVSSGRVRVPEAAGFLPGEESLPGRHERVSLTSPLVIPGGGKYVYLWVSNESSETKVWFDDFSVTHTTKFVAEATDYGVWGDVLRTSSSEAPPRQSIRKGLKGQYAFTGNASNQAGGSMNGTVTGATLTTDREGEANQAYAFDGTDDYITLAGSADGLSFIQNTGIFTITAFIKLSDLNARSVIVGNSGTASRKGFSFAYDTYGSEYGTHALRFSSTVGDGVALNIGTGNDYGINDLNWHHVAVVGDGSSFRFYLDGVADGHSTAITSYGTGASSYDVLIGAARNTSTGIILPMHGAIDEVHIFDKALSDSEIRLLAAGASTEDIDRVLQPASRKYPYGYQGLYAERDEETGWSHFGLREYDPVIGRWMVRDPFKQYWSPYVGMGNNPLSGIDPTGGYTKGWARIMSGFGLWGTLTESGEDNGREVWGYVNDDGYHFGDDARTWVRGINWERSNSILARSTYWDDNFNSFVTGNGIEPVYIGTDFNDVVDGAAAISQGYYVDGSMALASAAFPWISWKSVKFFGHAFLRHGQGDKITKKLIDRARDGTPQGQWLDNQAAADMIREIDGTGSYSIFNLPEGMGQVIRPDGTIVPATRAIVIPGKTAYPIE